MAEELYSCGPVTPLGMFTWDIGTHAPHRWQITPTGRTDRNSPQCVLLGGRSYLQTSVLLLLCLLGVLQMLLLFTQNEFFPPTAIRSCRGQRSR